MTENKTKKRKISKAERLRRKRRERRMKFGVIALVLTCICAVGIMPLLNRLQAEGDYAYTQADDIWYVPNGEMEISAVTRDQSQTIGGGSVSQTAPAVLPEATESALESLPFIAEATATANPTVQPTAEPTPAQETVQPLNETTLTITAVGDCTLGGNTNSGGSGEASFAKCVSQNGYDYFFQNVRDIFESDDLTIVNLEGTLTTSQEKRSGRYYNFRGDPSYVNILSGSSVEICNVANNHAYDFSKSGFQETTETLNTAGIGASGFGLEYYTIVKGVKVGSLGFTEWDYEPADIQSAIRAAREKCDLLIVSVHWGEEKTYTPSKNVEKLGRMMVDAGADLVIGNHSHVYGSIEQYKGKYIIYSLGNFCFGGNKNPSVKSCTIFQQSFSISGDGSVSDAGINLIPASVSSHSNYNDFQPMLLSGESGKSLLAKIAKLSGMTSDSVTWMQSSYAVQNGLVTLDAGDDTQTDANGDGETSI